MGEFPLIFKNVEYDANEVMGDYMKTLYEDDKKEKRKENYPQTYFLFQR